MPHTIFFSWQSDVPPKTGRNLIERALERAVGAVMRDSVVVEATRDGIGTCMFRCHRAA